MCIILLDMTIRSTSQTLEFCTSYECSLKSTQMANTMNDLYDPCDDFYSYSCGHYSRSPSYEQELKSHWNRIFWKFLDRTSWAFQSGLLSQFFTNVTQCQTGSKDAVTCLREKLLTGKGLVGNIGILASNAQNVHDGDARKIVDSVIGAILRHPPNGTRSVKPQLGIMRNHPDAILISKETLPSLDTLARVMGGTEVTDPDEMIERTAIRPKWLSEGFADFTGVKPYRKYGYVGEFTFLRI